MASSFKGLDLFGSGPHRFAVKKQGQLVVPELSIGGAISGSAYLGPLEPAVIVTGRLVAADEAGLWTLRDAVAAELLDPPDPGMLVDLHGRAWNDMSLVTFEPGDRTDRGRVVSLSYTAVFLDFRTYP